MSLPASFPSQGENVQVTLTEESRSEGKIGLKAYRNYFTAGANWVIIIVLILVNVSAQVNRDLCFVLRPQLDIYSNIYVYTVFIYTP